MTSDPRSGSSLPPWRRWVLWVGFLVLLVLHLDFWRPQRAVLHFGWVPEEMLWRLAWMALAWAYLLLFTRWVWEPER